MVEAAITFMTFMNVTGTEGSGRPSQTFSKGFQQNNNGFIRREYHHLRPAIMENYKTGSSNTIHETKNPSKKKNQAAN